MDFKCNSCGTELLDRDSREDAQYDHDTATNCNGQVQKF